MLFGLENTGATYQRAAIALFHDMMHKEVKVYVNDMMVKSEIREGHFEASGNERGIEVDPDKIKAIQEMSMLKKEKDVRGFIRKLQYISRFIAKLTMICDLVFKLLRKNQPVEWNEECQKAFEKIKKYLTSPPVLKPPRQGKPLILYLGLKENTIVAMLAQARRCRACSILS